LWGIGAFALGFVLIIAKCSIKPLQGLRLLDKQEKALNFSFAEEMEKYNITDTGYSGCQWFICTQETALCTLLNKGTVLLAFRKDYIRSIKKTTYYPSQSGLSLFVMTIATADKKTLDIEGSAESIGALKGWYNSFLDRKLVGTWVDSEHASFEIKLDANGTGSYTAWGNVEHFRWHVLKNHGVVFHQREIRACFSISNNELILNEGEPSETKYTRTSGSGNTLVGSWQYTVGDVGSIARTFNANGTGAVDFFGSIVTLTWQTDGNRFVCILPDDVSPYRLSVNTLSLFPDGMGNSLSFTKR